MSVTCYTIYMSAESLPKAPAVLDILPDAPVSDVTTLPEVMQQVADRLHSAGLSHVVPGLLGYKAVTEEVLDGTYNDVFKYPEKMQATMPVFADLLFQSVRQYAEGNHDTVGPWKPLFDIENSADILPSTAMYDFMQIHIRCDLYKALRLTDTEPKHKEDYDEKINMILSEVGHRILYDYIELHPAIKRIKVPEVAMKFILNEIYRARDEAWAAFEMVQEGVATTDEMDEILSERAEKRMLSTHKLAGHVLRQTTRLPDGFKLRPASGLVVPE